VVTSAAAVDVVAIVYVNTVVDVAVKFWVKLYEIDDEKEEELQNPLNPK
jgi:hypothetical protein